MDCYKTSIVYPCMKKVKKEDSLYLVRLRGRKEKEGSRKKGLLNWAKEGGEGPRRPT